MNGLALDYGERGGLLHITEQNEEFPSLDFALCDFDLAIGQRIEGTLTDEGEALLCVPCAVSFTAKHFGRMKPLRHTHGARRDDCLKCTVEGETRL